MTKLELFEKESGLKLIAKTTVWNLYGISSLASVAKTKGSNLHKEFKEMKKDGMTGGFTLVVGCIGRSQHCATEVGIFQGVNDEFYNEQIFINEPNSKFWV